MKKTLFLAAALFSTTFLFAQKQPAARQAIENAKKQVQVNDSSQLVAKVEKYAIVLDKNQLIGLYQFIAQADIYSDKGRSQFLDDLKKYVFLLPATTDTAKKK